MFEQGKQPSIDRLNPYGHYEESNLQVITFQENVARRIPSSNRIKASFSDGSYKLFESILEAAEDTGSSRTTVKEQLKYGARFNKRGIKFERVEANG